MNIALKKESLELVWMTREFTKGDEYICKCCSKPVIPHCGQKKKWHFQHKSLKECALSEKYSSENSMSEFHRRFQWEFFKIGGELEKRYEKNIADVYFQERVFEIQNSNISYKKTKQRSDNYLEYTGKQPIWILNLDTQNVKNYPGSLLKILVGTFQIQIYHENIKIALEEKDPISKVMFFCQNLSEINKLLEYRKLEPKVRELQQYYVPVIKVYQDEENYFEHLVVKKIFENICFADKQVREIYKKISPEQLASLKEKRNEVLNLKGMKRYFISNSFKKKSHERILFTKYALEFFSGCIEIVHLQTSSQKHKGKTVDEIDDNYVIAMISIYFRKQNPPPKEKKQYYKNLIFTMLRRNIKNAT